MASAKFLAKGVDHCRPDEELDKARTPRDLHHSDPFELSNNGRKLLSDLAHRPDLMSRVSSPLKRNM